MIPSGPRPTKETYLATLRTLKEHHNNTEEEHNLVRNSPIKAAVGKAKLCVEEVVLTKQAEETPVHVLTQKKQKSVAIKGGLEGIARREIASTREQQDSKTVVPAATASHTTFANKGIDRQVTHSTALGTVSTKSAKFTAVSQSSKRVSAGTTDPVANHEAQRKKKLKLGRKATRRFTVLAGMLPNLKLDKSIKLEVAETLKEMDCWSDDEPESGMASVAEDSDSDSSASEAEHNDSTQLMGASSTSLQMGKSMKSAAPGVSTKLTNLAAVVGASKKVKSAAAEGKSTKAHAYLEQQKETARQKAKEAMVKKAIKLYVRVRKDETEARRRQEWLTSGKYAVERAVTAKFAATRWYRILDQALPVAVARRVKMDRRKRREERRRNQAQCVIRHAWRKFRVRFLLNCVVEFIRIKARIFREEQVREEREFRMRTARRRVSEDCLFKEWVAEQRVFPTFPVKPDTEPVAVVSPRLLGVEPHRPVYQAQSPVKPKEKFRLLFDSSVPPPKASTLSPRPPGRLRPAKATPSSSTAGNASQGQTQGQPGFFLTEGGGAGDDSSHNIGGNPLTGSAAGLSVDTGTAIRSPRSTPNASAALSFSQAAPTAKRLQPTDYEFARPDLAPFSTMINNMITHSTLFQSQKEQDWMDLASVSADYAAQFKDKKKSPAYRALEKLCGITEADVLRSQLQSHRDKDGAHLKLKSFGHSIVSL